MSAASVALLVLAPLGALVPVAAAPDDGGESLAWTDAPTPAGVPVQGVADAGGMLLASTFDHGTYRSTDGGLHWGRIAGFPPVTKGRIALDPADPLVAYVAGKGGMARTGDGGLTWSHVLDVSRVSRVHVSPEGRVLAGVHQEKPDGHVGNFLYRSEDGGATWQDLGVPFPDDEPICGVAFGRSEDELLTMTNRQSWHSHDGGLTWTEQEGAGFNFGIEEDGTVWRVDMGFIQVTLDGGATWTDVDAPGVGTVLGTVAGGGITFASNAGLLRTRDRGATWENLGHPDGMLAVTGLAPDASDPDAVWITDSRIGIARLAPEQTGGEQDGGAYVLEGRTAGLPPTDVDRLARSADGTLWLASGPHGVHVSRDAGQTWAHPGAGLGMGRVERLAASHDGSAAMAGGTDTFGEPAVEASRDGGRAFTRFGFPVGASGTVAGLAFDNADASHAFAAVALGKGLHPLFETRDGGATWSRVAELPVAPRDAAWHSPTGLLLLASEAGVLAWSRHGLLLPAGGAGDVSRVASDGGAAFAASELGMWRDAGGAGLMLPYMNHPHRAPLNDLAADPDRGDEAWASFATGDLRRCAGVPGMATCADASPPEAGVRAVLLAQAGDRVVVATPFGLRTAEV